MNNNPLMEQLIGAFCLLPSVGPKSAQRMAFHLLARDRTGGLKLADILSTAMAAIQHCDHCRHFTEQTRCHYCTNTRRDPALLCIVESPADVLAIEQTGYQGLYFVLHGHLSPIDGIGPEEIGISLLKKRLENGDFQEVILATNPTVEGNTTAHYISELVKVHHIPCSRIAHGVPIGGELEYIDGSTLSHAIAGRETL